MIVQLADEGLDRSTAGLLSLLVNARRIDSLNNHIKACKLQIENAAAGEQIDKDVQSARNDDDCTGCRVKKLLVTLLLVVQTSLRIFKQNFNPYLICRQVISTWLLHVIDISFSYLGYSNTLKTRCVKLANILAYLPWNS